MALDEIYRGYRIKIIEQDGELSARIFHVATGRRAPFGVSMPSDLDIELCFSEARALVDRYVDFLRN